LIFFEKIFEVIHLEAIIIEDPIDMAYPFDVSTFDNLDKRILERYT